MYIARRISTQEWINDFQEKATPDALIANAVAAGIPSEDVEVVDLSQAEYDVVKETVIAPLRLIAEQQAALTRQQLLDVLNNARTSWGWTKPQMKSFVQAVKQVAEGDLDNL
jgi:Asp-tRNA(Asn)/Glu-tRNA(Gln) amidotransferase B subunit